MGCFSCLGGKSARRVRLMFVGLDGAGKSTLLQTIAGDPEEPTVPTVGFHNVALRRERTFDSGFDVDVFDLIFSSPVYAVYPFSILFNLSNSACRAHGARC